MDLTFGTYNLEFGGFDNGSDARLRRQLKMLAELNADVWAFQECSDWAAQRTPTQGLVEEALGMRGFLAPSGRGPGGDLGIFIREPSGIRMSMRWHEGHPYHHGVAHIVCTMKGYGPIRFASAHLSPASPTKRLEEAEVFQLLAEKDHLGPLIAGGDWNARAVDDPEPVTEGINPGKARRKKDRRAAEALSEYMTDTGWLLNDTTPTVGHTREDNLAYRADRIYTTLPADSITRCQVIHEDNPESDHRPVTATFTL